MTHCALQNHVLAIVFLERCTRASCAFVNLSWIATREEGFTVTHGGGVTPGKRNTKTFTLVQFDR